MGSSKGPVPLQAGDLSTVCVMFQAALAAKSSCIDSLQAVAARQSEELALAWASIEKERQARGVAEEGVKALQCALDKSREELRKEMLTRRGDHHKLLQQLSCEWEVLAVLEEEQARREAAEMALALMQRWMERTLLRCQQLQHQHRLQRQQLKAWARHAAAEHDQVRQLCEHADVDLPDFLSLLHQHADAGPPTDAWGAKAAEASQAGPEKDPVHDSKCEPDAAGEAASLPGSPKVFSKHSGGFGSDCNEKGGDIPVGGATPPMSKSSSWSDLSGGGMPRGYPLTMGDSRTPERSRSPYVQQQPAGQERQEDELSGVRTSFEFTPPLQTQDESKPQPATFWGRAQQLPSRRELSGPSAVVDSKPVRSPNKTPRSSANKVQSTEFGGIVKRIIRGSVSPLEAKVGKASSGSDPAARGFDVLGSKSAPTSPLRRSCAAMRMGPPQGLKDLACNAFLVRDGTRRSRGEKMQGSCVHRQCGEQGQESTSKRSLVMR